MSLWSSLAFMAVGFLADGLPNCTTQNYSGSRYVFLGKTSIEEKKTFTFNGGNFDDNDDKND